MVVTIILGVLIQYSTIFLYFLGKWKCFTEIIRHGLSCTYFIFLVLDFLENPTSLEEDGNQKM